MQLYRCSIDGTNQVLLTASAGIAAADGMSFVYQEGWNTANISEAGGTGPFLDNLVRVKRAQCLTIVSIASSPVDQYVLIKVSEPTRIKQNKNHNRMSSKFPRKKSANDLVGNSTR